MQSTNVRLCNFAPNVFPFQARHLSTSSAAAQLVKPPVQIFGLEGRYACALYSAASKTKALEAVEKDLKGLQREMRGDQGLRDLLINPTIKRSLKASALSEVSAKVKFNAATGNLLTLLAENGRLGRLDGIVNAYSLIMAAERGEVVCEVTTARALDDSQRKQLEGALKVIDPWFILYIMTNIILSFVNTVVPETKPEHSADCQGRPIFDWWNDCLDW